MFDDLDSKPGVITIIPGAPQTTAPQAPTPPAGPQTAGPQPATPPSPASQTAAPQPIPSEPSPVQPSVAVAPPSDLLAGIIRSALALGVYITPPAAGTPAAAAVEEIAKQCQQPVTEVHKVMRSLSRAATLAKQSISSSDKKEQGSIFAILVSPPAVKTRNVSPCIAAASPPAVLDIELLVSAREFGPMDAQRVQASAQAQLATALSAAFGDPARPWRIATTGELLAILPVLLAENLWGPDGGQFWTSDVLSNGGRIILETKTEKQDYRVILNLVDATAKATPIWVRSWR